jgi:soluble lytic murein transglycosylase-like protein
MADETAPTPAIPDDQLNQIIRQLLSGQTAQPAVDPNAGRSSREGRSVGSLLGEAVGGGARYGSTSDREQGGYAALGALGARMLQASDWSTMPHTFGSILGQGLEAARGSLGQTQAVSAARQAAAQDYAHQANADQIARLKEALPYLQMQRDNAAMARMREGLKGNNTSIGTGGSIGTAGDYTVPSDLLPIYKAEAERTGVPVELLIAQHKQESNLNPGATGGAGEVGLGQILPSTAKSPGFGMAGVDPGALRTPAANIRFSADYLAARAKAAGADFKTPEGTVKALRAYNGGGDPNYAQNVLRYVPGAQKALAGGAPPPAPGPATTPPAGRATLPPPEAPLAGTAQTAGPGGPTGTVVPPSPAGSEAHVQDIISGMVGAGANPTTLAPGPGSSPAAQPGAVVTAQAGGQPPTPEFQMRPLTPTEQAATSYSLDPQVERALQLRINGATNPKDLSEAIDARKTALIEQRKTADAARLKIEETTRKDWRDERSKVDDEARKQANAKELELIKSGLTVDQQGALVALEGWKEQMKKSAESASAMLPVSEQLRQLPSLMRDLPPGGALSTILGEFPQFTSLLEQAGVIKPGTTDAVTVFTGLTNHLSTQLRVSGAGGMSDKDLNSFKTVMPRLLQSSDGRAKAVAFLQNIADRIVEGNSFTQDYFSRIDPRTGKPAHNLTGLPAAINAPRSKGGLGPVMPAAPRFSQDERGAAEAEAWLQENTRSGRPFTAWVPNEKGVLTQQILVRE